MPQPLNWPTQAKPCLYGTWLWLVRKWQSREQSLWFPLWGRKHISELTFKIGGWQIGYSCSINYHFKVRDGFLHVDSVRLGISIHIFVSNGLVTLTFFLFFLYFYFYFNFNCNYILSLRIKLIWKWSNCYRKNFGWVKFTLSCEFLCEFIRIQKNQLLKMFRLNKTHTNLNWARLFW